MDGGKKQGKMSKASSHGKKGGFTKKYKWYTCGKPKQRASERDRKFFLVPLDAGREKEKITKGVEEMVAEAPEVEKKELQAKLHITGVKLHIKENTEAHHTDDYECTKDRISFIDQNKDCPDSEKTKEKAELVIRRGQDFKLTIDFDRPYEKNKNDIKLVFNLGDDCEPHKGLNFSIKVDETGKYTRDKPKTWEAKMVGQEANSLTVMVFVPASAPIGDWDFSVKTVVEVKNGENIIWEYKHTSDFITILFNPWCKEDLVYQENEEWRKECVESDSGSVYTGSWRKIGVRSWCFGQYKDGILDAALSLLRTGFGGKPTRKMASPSAVSRMISQMVNAPGVLVGNWSGDYSGGTKPTAWNGSVKILRQYLTTGKPVKFGQCWVFSGVTTTVCRALGLPCRSVTNHSSAHNTDRERLSIDVISRKGWDGEWHDIKDDSIWNFHVWNECWFRTPNLNTDQCNYDGWQIIDATPQEYSDGVFRCGPAPLIAVKEGHIGIGFDTHFVYAEGNADKVFWKEDESSGRLFERKRDRKCVGRSISTHKPTGKPYNGSSSGSYWFTRDIEREDLTSAYKYPEGSDKEKEITKMAEKKFRQICCVDDDGESDHECEEEEPVDITIEEIGKEVEVGNGFGFSVTVKNRGSEDRTMNLTLKVLYKTYFDSCTGIAAKKKFNDVKLKKGASEKFIIEVDEDCACQRPQDGFNFEVTAFAKFKENDHIVTEEIDFRLRKPDIQVKGPSKCSMFDTIKIDLSFKNPLKTPLTQCYVDLEGGFDCVGDTKDMFYVPNIGPGMTWEKTLQLRPSLSSKSERDISIGFDAKELSDINGKYKIEIQK